MHNSRVGRGPTLRSRRLVSMTVIGLTLIAVGPAQAQAPAVTLGAGLQTSFRYDSPDEGDGTGRFIVNSARLYVNGSVSDTIKVMFNTEYDGSTSHVGVIDAVARMEFSPAANIWVGRFLPPSDRANLYGPYYSNHFAVYTDGVQDGYPFVTTGRDDGVAYWGQFGMVKVSAGAFDGVSATGNSDLLTAARVQVDFWDPEDGYYLNGTYYGAKKLLALGGAVQAQDGETAASVDFLLEVPLDNGSAVTVESEYASYDGLGGYDGDYVKSQGGYVLAAYLFPPPSDSAGRLQLLGKVAQAKFSEGLTFLDPDYEQTTTEVNVNYLLREFNGRVMFFFKHTSFTDVRRDFSQFGVGFQFQI